jgi:hypothetical protein
MIVFTNPGLIDLRALKTFGVSAKENDSAIGYFGTGLKYALAILLREGCKVTLFRGKRKFEFTSKPTKVRNDQFDMVYMNGEELAFTTALGKDWELWQAFRELWCNTTDESGNIDAISTDRPTGAAALARHTTIVVEHEDFDAIYENRASILLTDEPDLVLPGVEVRFRPSDYVYFRGIRVQKLQKPSALTYNLTKQIYLTEDRTVKYDWEPRNIIKAAIIGSTDIGFVTKVLTADGMYESGFDFKDTPREPSGTFVSTVDSLRGAKTVNKSAMAICREAMRKQMDVEHGQQLVGVPAIQLEKAEKFCESIGCSLAGIRIIVVDSLGDARASLFEEGRLFLTPEVFVKGTRGLAITLINATIADSVDAEDRLVNRLISLGEKLNGEPL